MIGKISSGSDFAGCVGYALADKEKNKEARLLYSEGVLDDSPHSIVDGFECQRRMNHRVEKWVGHISLSYSPEDSARLSDEAMVKLAHEYMAKMGIRILTRSIRTATLYITGSIMTANVSPTATSDFATKRFARS